METGGEAEVMPEESWQTKVETSHALIGSAGRFVGNPAASSPDDSLAVPVASAAGSGAICTFKQQDRVSAFIPPHLVAILRQQARSAGVASPGVSDASIGAVVHNSSMSPAMERKRITHMLHQNPWRCGVMLSERSKSKHPYRNRAVSGWAYMLSEGRGSIEQGSALPMA
jgi:hypothetical protein